MELAIPLPLREEHDELHRRLRQAAQADGEVGELARELARLMHPHFVKEDEVALPPLGLLRALAEGGAAEPMGEVLALTDRLRAELPAMLAEHAAIVAALGRLHDAAGRAGRDDIVQFTQQLTHHARVEEEVMYPAALLVGEVVRQRLG